MAEPFRSLITALTPDQTVAYISAHLQTVAERLHNGRVTGSWPTLPPLQSNPRAKRCWDRHSAPYGQSNASDTRRKHEPRRC